MALRVMETLEEFDPYLHGSVLTGAIHPDSDVDLLAYADRPDHVADRLLEAGHEVEFRLERSRRRGLVRAYPHYFLQLKGTTVEISVYPDDRRHQAPESSVTGHGVRRASLAAVRRLVRPRGSVRRDSGGECAAPERSALDLARRPGAPGRP